MLLRETFPVGSFQCNCTVLACPTTRQALIIDPGGGTRRIAELVAHHDLEVVAIIHTHAHLDHIYCTREVKQTHGGEIMLHPDDRFLYDGIAMQAAMFGWQVEPTLPVDRYLADGDQLAFGDGKALVLHTPGHTPGSVCFEVRDGDETVVFSGDTLFQGSIGRTDLPGGDTRTLLTSIANRLYTREPSALVIPGHGPSTTIEREAATNPFVRARLR
jgi:glyoxylase-like metal-dependent hydrolase (beta-lactamase superfamily II)